MDLYYRAVFSSAGRTQTQIIMSGQDKIRALAELDGWTDIQLNTNGEWIGIRWVGCHQKLKRLQQIPYYLVSRDAIIPLIEKHWIQFGLNGNEFRKALKVMVDNDVCCDIHTTFRILLATPAQPVESLLRATGKWKE